MPPCCSGVDGLAHDPLAGSWALTPAAYAACAAQAAAWGRPLLLLGGGGYDSPSAACTWAGVLAGLLGRQLPDDIPEHDFFERYGPGFTLSSGAQSVCVVSGYTTRGSCCMRLLVAMHMSNACRQAATH